MPKQMAYPLHSFDECIEIASDIYHKKEIHKEKLAELKNCSLSGQFQLLLSSGSKYNLFKQRKGMLIANKEIENIILAYSHSEKDTTIKKCILYNDFLNTIYQHETDLSDTILLEKKLIKKYNVDIRKAPIVRKVIQDNSKYLPKRVPEQSPIDSSPVSRTLEPTEVNTPNPENTTLNGAFNLTSQSISCNLIINDINDLDLLDLIIEKVRTDYSKPI